MFRRKKRGRNRDSNEEENGRSTHDVIESDAEDHEEFEEDDNREWQENFLQQLEDHNVEIEVKTQKKTKEKGEEHFFVDKRMSFNESHNYYNNLIREGKKHEVKDRNIVTK